MKFDRHLFVDAVDVPPGVEWRDSSPVWRFVRISEGVAYWLARTENRELTPGEVVVLSPSGDGTVRASQLGEVRLHCFQFCPEWLGGILTLSERHGLDQIAARQTPPVRFLPADHPAAVRFGEMIMPARSSQGLLQRCDALCLAISFFAEHIPRQPSPPTKTVFALHRFRELIHQMPDQHLLNHTPQELAQICGCSVRHFGRLFRRHFGIPFRRKRTELRLALACKLLLESAAKILSVAMESGYHSLGLFNGMFKRAFGTTPSQWRRQHAQQPASPQKDPSPVPGS